MWMPDWLYERLPLIYLIAGLACLLRVGAQPSAGLSALMLLGAAALVFNLRRQARHKIQTAKRKRPAKRWTHGGPAQPLR